MEFFSMQTELVLGVTAAASFTLGWIAHRYLLARRERISIELLTNQIGRLERQRDAAHRVALDLAATHSDLLKEHQEAKWKSSNIESNLSMRRPKADRVVDGYEVRVMDMDVAPRPLLSA